MLSRRVWLVLSAMLSVLVLAPVSADDSPPSDTSAREQESVEIFPLACSIIMLFVSVLFSIWVVVTSKTTPSPDQKKERLHLPNRSSWVHKTVSRIFGSTRHASEMSLDEEMATVSSEPSALLSWSQVSCSYPSRNASDPPFVSLHNSYGEMRATELTAIMGGSGSGKSTLLDILSGRKTSGELSGNLSVLGKVLDNIQTQAIDEGGALRSVAAYIPQREAFFPTQTAEEAVAFAANLKLGKDPRGDNVRWSRIQSVLRDVGLSSETCNRPIGGELAGGIVIRGLSGGERKRLAVACALALKPRLLFLDEITSGLDSENALAITKLLKRLCSSKRVAATMVIHQPNGRLFREFDRLVLLSKGHLVFSDDTSRLPNLYQDIFKSPMPEWYDLPSDLLTQVVDFSKENASAIVDDSRALVATRPGSLVKSPGLVWKFKIVFQRNLTNHYVRNITNLASRLIMYAATSLINGLLFWQVGDIAGEFNVTSEISAVVGALSFINLVTYLGPFSLIPLYVHDKQFFLAESALGLYSPWVYCLSQLILETWVIVMASTIETCIIIPMCGLFNPAIARWESFFTFLGALIVSGLTGNALVLFHAMALPSQDLAFMAGSGVVTISLALSGAFVPFPQMEDFISWLQWVFPCKYSLQSLSLAVFQGTRYEDLANEIYAFDNPATVSGNMGVLFAFTGVLAVGTVFAMSRQREVR